MEQNKYLLVLAHSENEDIPPFYLMPKGRDILSDFHKYIDGFIEIVRMAEIKPYVMVVDDNGLNEELPINPVATILYKNSWIVGNAIFCKEVMTEEGPDLDYLDENDSLILSEFFYGLMKIIDNNIEKGDKDG